MTETITTAEARDALPPGVIVRSAAGTIACRHDGGMGVCFGVERPFAWDQLALPLTVLYRPDQPTPTKPSAEAIAKALHSWDVLALLPGRTEAEVKAEALDAILGPIEALHYPANRDFDRTPICADCHGKAGTHPCGCWAEYDQYPICGECGAQEHMPLESDDYPCPTRRACDQIRAELGGGEQ